MRRALLFAALALPLGACDGGAYAPASSADDRQNVQYIAYATGPRFRYRLALSGLWPAPVQRDTAGSVSMTYAVPCGSPITLTLEALGAVPPGASVELAMTVGGQSLASAKGSRRVHAASTLRCE